MKKNYSLGKGKYYFNVKAGHANITIHRASKRDALNTYESYKKVGKEVEWLGKWNGKKFIEATEPETATTSA
jgi:hypothetical protein